MKPQILIPLLVVTMIAAAISPAAAAPLAGPCIAGLGYDPGCDVDHDGDVDIFDIQLTAGRWGTSGPYVGDGWLLTGNAGTTPGTNFLGTTDNQALQIKVNNSRALLIQPDSSGNPNIVGGASSNTVMAGVYGATIAGGGTSLWANSVTDHHGTVGGGQGNRAGNNDAIVTNSTLATVAGGWNNMATANVSTIGGGQSNNATNYLATIAGGESNTASGHHATVSGGYLNTASSHFATIPGGSQNTAAGLHSFAAGRRAKANHDGTFVWADVQDSDFASTTSNAFQVRVENGMYFLANNAGYGGLVRNDGTGDGLRAFATSSLGDNWAAVYANNFGTSPGINAQSAGTYAGYFQDQIYVNGGCTGCTLMYAAVNAGQAALDTGDLVAAAGVARALNGTVDQVLRVVQSGPDAQGVIGVVFGRATVTPTEKEGATLDSLQAAEGAVQPGDYLLIVVQGLAQVNVAPEETLTPGQRLKASHTPGQARALRTTVVDGVTLDEGGPVIGVLLDAPIATSGLAPVMVTLR